MLYGTENRTFLRRLVFIELQMLPEVVRDLDAYRFLQERNLAIRLADSNRDAKEVTELEISSYDEADAASPETIEFRLQKAGPYFAVLFDTKSNEMIGFINGTCCNGATLEHESMTTHDAGREFFCCYFILSY